MNKLLVAGIAATTIAGVWSGCFVAGSTPGTTKGTGGTGGSSSSSTTTSSSSSTSTTTGTGGQVGAGGASGFGGGTSGFGGNLGGGGSIPNPVLCNPVTNAKCATGTVCGPVVSNEGKVTGFACSAPDAGASAYSVADCGSCDPAGLLEPFCLPGSVCLPSNANGTAGQCVHYCCTLGDCGLLAECSTTNTSNGSLFGPASTTLGVCVAKAPPTDAGADGGDAGAPVGDAGNSIANGEYGFACMVPSKSPSGGACL